ncbi:hypothetical protein GGI11_007575, partial [Coemansia sp. RSA 2049]
DADNNDDDAVGSDGGQQEPQAINASVLVGPSDVADDMDEDDICPICEDECTCGNTRNPKNTAESANSFSAAIKTSTRDDDDDDNDGAPMPLFSQIATKPTVDSATLSSGAAAASGVVGQKPRPIPAKTNRRTQRKKATGKTLIARLEYAMEQGKKMVPAEEIDDDIDDEFVNITDVTSDAFSDVDGPPSETEFDMHRRRRGNAASPVNQLDEWSDADLGDSGDEDIAQEETTYLTTIGDAGSLSSSSLSDFDDARVRRMGSRAMDSGVDSGDESDSESISGDANGLSRRRGWRVKRSWRRQRQYERDTSFANDDDEEEEFGNSDSESDQELTFREARTAQERALATASDQQGDREDALLQMHLDQLYAVRSVIQECSSPLLEHAAMEAESSGADERGMVTFTYRPPDSSATDDSDSDSDDDSDESSDMSKSLVGGWYRTADLTDSDSNVSNGNAGSERSEMYSSDSYQEFYARRAFLGVGGNDSSDDEGAAYTAGMDLDSASLAL